MKKIIAIVFIILVLAGCIAGLIFLNSEVTITHNVSENTFDIPELKMADSKLLTTAIRTDVEKWIEIEGNVTGPTDEILNTIFIKRITDINALAVKTGDHVLKDDILFSNGKYKYLSPVNGRIANINQQGNNLRVTIVNYDCLYISAQIPQIYIDEAVIGEHVDIEYNEEWVNGTISYVDYQVNTDKTICIKISYEDSQMKIRPGSFVKIKIIEQIAKNVVAVPLNALIKGTHNIYYVQLVNDNNEEYCETVSIEVGLVGNALAEVVEGLSAGDRILVQEGDDNIETESSGT